MKNFLILYLLLWSSLAWAVAPYGIKGQQQTTTYPNVYQFPNKQVTGLGGINALVENGNTNELENSGFEHSTLTTGWTITGSTAAETSSPLSGKKTLKISTSSSLMSLSQVSTINAAQQVGVQKTCSVYVKAATHTDIQLCSLVDSTSVTDKCTAVGGYVAGTGKRKLTVSFLGGATSSGCMLKTSANATGDIYVDDFTMGDGAPIVDFTNTTDWVLYTPTYSAGFGLVGTSYVYWRRSGDSIEIQGTFVTGTVAGSTATLTIPSGLTIDTTKLASGGQPRLLGFGGRFVSAVPNTLSVIYGSTTTIGFSRYADAGTNGTNGPQNGSAIFASTESESFYAKIPIVEYGGKSSSSYVASGSQASSVVYSAKGVTTSGAVSDLNVANWISCTNAANPTVCTFAAGTFTVTPNCVASPSGTSVAIISTSGASSSGISIGSYLATSPATPSASQPFNLVCQKQGADYSSSFNPVIVGSFQDVVTVTGTTKPKLLSQLVTVSGSACTPSTGDSLVASGVRNGTGDCTMTFVSNIWASAPQCWLEGYATSASSTAVQTKLNASNPVSTTALRTVTTNQAGTATDHDYFLFCKGVSP